MADQDSAPEMDDLRLAFFPDLDNLPIDLVAILDGPDPILAGPDADETAKLKKPRPTIILEASSGGRRPGGGRKARNYGGGSGKARKFEDPNTSSLSIASQKRRKQQCAEARAARAPRVDAQFIAELGCSLSRQELAEQRRALARFRAPVVSACICLGQGMAGFVCGCQQAPEPPSSMGVAGGIIDLGDIEFTPPNCCVCLGNDCAGGSNKFKCVECDSGCCEEVARQGLGTEWCLKCPNVVDGSVCGAPLTAAGKAKKKEKAIDMEHKKLKVQDEVQRCLAENGYFGTCPCGEDYFYENDSFPTVKCSSCFADIVLFTPPAPEHWDDLSDAFAFTEIYGGQCPHCKDKVTRTPAYEILESGKFSREQTGGCASTLHDKCGTTMCIGGNRNCRAFLKSVSNPEEVHHVTDHFCHCYGPRIKFDGTCSACNKCRLYYPVEHWCYIFLLAKVEWYQNNQLPVPADVLDEIEFIEENVNIYADA
jgi:hypothetical protein